METRSGIYRDSVRLMEISAALAKHSGVESALVAMATGLNLELLTGMGFATPSAAAPNDMLVALVTTDETVLGQALELLETELAGSGSAGAGNGAPSTGGQVVARTTASAARLVPDPALVLVSTPGRHAFVEAMDALDAGASVMVFSDNLPVDQEVLLKRTATERGLLVMGPDCGTAVVGGVGLGFANVVRQGPVGLVAASGTGAQQVMSLLAGVPVGISHCLGVGGRDLSEAVGGLSTHAALDALDADEGTELIVLIGKPPAPAVDEAVRAHAEKLSTPVLVAPLGLGQRDLTAVVEKVLRRFDIAPPSWPVWEPVGAPDPLGGGRIRGLFSGGTLCVEAMVIAAEELAVIRSNIPLRPEWTLDPTTDGHTMIDLGADEYTVGRPHPMIDFGPRLALIEAEAADPDCRVLLLDVVLGHGAHPDPAAELAPAVRAALAARGDAGLTVVISLIGSPDDPQDYRRQATALSEAGAWVFASNAAATRHAVAVLQSGHAR